MQLKLGSSLVLFSRHQSDMNKTKSEPRQYVVFSFQISKSINKERKLQLSLSEY